MISKSKVRIIQSLDQKKFREKHNLFICEGNKIIKEVLKSNIEIEDIFCLENNFELIDLYPNINIITKNELNKISHLKNPTNSIAVLKIINKNENNNSDFELILDGVQDPGNLGTIIRLADWFGIKKIICSKNTCDLYNPKVIQSSMGSFLRVNLIYCDLLEFIKKNPKQIITTSMKGKNIYTEKLPNKGYLVLGNEGNGISENIINISNEQICIPQFSEHNQTESLNVAIATSIILSKLIGDKN